MEPSREPTHSNVGSPECRSPVLMTVASNSPESPRAMWATTTGGGEAWTKLATAESANVATSVRMGSMGSTSAERHSEAHATRGFAGFGDGARQIVYRWRLTVVETAPM